MISSDRHPDLQRQQIEIAMNTRGTGLPVRNGQIPILPYDPNQPPDDPNTPQYTATNLIDNTDFDFSRDGYENDPPVGGDASHECYNWYRQRFIKVTDLATTATSTAVTSASGPFKAGYTYPMNFVLLNGQTSGEALVGTLTRVSDTAATLSIASDNTLTGAVMWFGTGLAETPTNALKGSSHSTFAANEGTNDIIPRWDKTNGWVEIGSDTEDAFDLACPLPINLVRPGVSYFFSAIFSQRAGTTSTDPFRLSVGIWDETAGQRRWLESDNMDLTVTPVGTTGATTYKYRIIADLDDGTMIMSDEVTIANGNATLSPTNYNRLVWEHATGILNFRIYREVGGVVKRVFTIRNGAHDFNDTGGDEGETPVSMPTVAGVKPIAYKVSQGFLPVGEGVWQRILIRLQIPSTYDTSNTTDRQWIRIAVEGDTGDERLVLLDRLMFATSDGGWQRSSRDLNKILNQNPDSLPTSTTQGDTGMGTGCFTFDTPILVCDRDGSNIRSVPIGEIDKGMFVVSGSLRPNRVREMSDSISRTIISFVLSNGITRRCSPSERFVTSRADKSGTRIDQLTLGDEILCWRAGRVEKATIEELLITSESERVRTIALKPGRTFVLGGDDLLGPIAHNNKQPIDIPELPPQV